MEDQRGRSSPRAVRGTEWTLPVGDPIATVASRDVDEEALVDQVIRVDVPEAAALLVGVDVPCEAAGHGLPQEVPQKVGPLRLWVSGVPGSAQTREVLFVPRTDVGSRNGLSPLLRVDPE